MSETATTKTRGTYVAAVFAQQVRVGLHFKLRKQ